MKKFIKKLKFEWKLGIAINIPIAILLIMIIYINSYIFNKTIIKEAIDVRLNKNYNFVDIALIKGHTNLSVSAYRMYKEEFLRKFPEIKIYPSEYVSTLFNVESPEIKDTHIKSVLTNGQKIIFYDKKKKILHGYFPIKAESGCLVCHSNVGPDSILGAITISIPLSSTMENIAFIKLLSFTISVLGIIIILFVLYFVYMKIGHTPIKRISEYLNLLAEGDLNFKIEQDLLEQPDVIGDLARNLNKLKEYLNNFNSKILDFSLKLTNQVDKVFKTVDAANKDIKTTNLNISEIELYIENIYRIINEISRKTIQINTLLRVLMNLSSKEEKREKIDWNNLNQTINNLNNETIELIDKIENILKEEEKILNLFEEVSNLFNKLNKTLEQINNYIYENLIISTYMKNLASTVRLENMERIIFNIFETDIDRFLLRIESHIKGIESLDPVRWSDPKALSFGKWLDSEEYRNLKANVKDFEFEKLESLYFKLFDLAKDIITASNREDYLTVEKTVEEIRKIYFELKGYLEELKGIYLQLLQSKEQSGGGH
jgi:methyl-accepting chemotaxis protein